MIGPICPQLPMIIPDGPCLSILVLVLPFVVVIFTLVMLSLLNGLESKSHYAGQLLTLADHRNLPLSLLGLVPVEQQKPQCNWWPAEDGFKVFEAVLQTR